MQSIKNGSILSEKGGIWMQEIQKLMKKIEADSQNIEYTKAGIKPLFSAPRSAKILIVGQAPGIKAQESRLFWNDQSGDNLRAWMGVERDFFYQSDLFAVVPMDYYYPGKGKSGDLPPRKGFAEKWHAETLALMPDIELIILVGKYAQDYYLKNTKEKNLTETVKAYKEYLPKMFPLVHPSPLNRRWMAKNPWFEEDVLPEFKKRVQEIIKGAK